MPSCASNCPPRCAILFGRAGRGCSVLEAAAKCFDHADGQLGSPTLQHVVVLLGGQQRAAGRMPSSVPSLARERIYTLSQVRCDLCGTSRRVCGWILTVRDRPGRSAAWFTPCIRVWL